MSMLHKQSAGILLPLFLAGMLFFTGCAHRESGREIPKEVAASAPYQQPQEESGEEALAEPGQKDSGEGEGSSGLTVKKKQNGTQTAKITVESPSTGASWSTSDEVLAQNLYDLLHIVNERFPSPLDLRAYDFVMTVTDSDGQTEEYKLWINYVRENEVIVEDEKGSQWNLSITDSNAVRRILSSLNG